MYHCLCFSAPAPKEKPAGSNESLIMGLNSFPGTVKLLDPSCNVYLCTFGISSLFSTSNKKCSWPRFHFFSFCSKKLRSLYSTSASSGFHSHDHYFLILLWIRHVKCFTLVSKHIFKTWLCIYRSYFLASWRPAGLFCARCLCTCMLLTWGAASHWLLVTSHESRWPLPLDCISFADLCLCCCLATPRTDPPLLIGLALFQWNLIREGSLGGASNDDWKKKNKKLRLAALF